MDQHADGEDQMHADIRGMIAALKQEGIATPSTCQPRARSSCSALGGTYTLLGFRVLDRSPQKRYVAVVGDSKIAGYAAGSNSLR